MILGNWPSMFLIVSLSSPFTSPFVFLLLEVGRVVVFVSKLGSLLITNLRVESVTIPYEFNVFSSGKTNS